MRSLLLGCCTLIVAGLLLAGCSGSKAATDAGIEAPSAEPMADAQPMADAEPMADMGADILGDWEGMLEIPEGPTLKIVFHITRDDEGMLQATADSPDQNAFGLPADQASYKDGDLFLLFEQVDGSFSGALQEDGEALEGELEQRGNVLPLHLTRVEQ